MIPFTSVFVVAACSLPDALVAQLGDPVFEVREQATVALLRLGKAAERAARAGRGSADPEVRRRCERVFTAKRLAFLTDPGSREFDYPGFRHFFWMLKPDPGIRPAYLAAVAECPELLAWYDIDPTAAARKVLKEARAESAERDELTRKGKNTRLLSVGRLAMVLLTAADRNVALTDEFERSLWSLLIHDLYQPWAGGNAGPIRPRYPDGISHLLMAYVRRWPPDTMNQRVGMYTFLSDYQLQRTGMPLACHLVRLPRCDRNLVHAALAAIRAYGGAEQLPAVEAVFADRREISVADPVNNTRKRLQLRDIALHAAEFLVSPTPARRAEPYPVFRPGSDDRERAFARYRAGRPGAERLARGPVRTSVTRSGGAPFTRPENPDTEPACRHNGVERRTGVPGPRDGQFHSAG